MNVIERCQATTKMLSEILNTVDEKEIEKLEEKLIKIKNNNKKVFVIAAGRANLVMRTFAMRLMQIGFNSFVVYDTNTPAISEGDLLIAGSGSGSTETVISIAKQALSKNAEVVCFTMKKDSPLAELSEVSVVVDTSARSEKIHTKGSEFEQSLFVLCDCIGVDLIYKFGYINDIVDIDPFIRKLHANLQ